MKPGLSLRVSQHLALTPQLQQSIRLLQLSTLELSQEVEQMLDDNPFLERSSEEAEREAYGVDQADAPVAEARESAGEGASDFGAADSGGAGASATDSHSEPEAAPSESADSLDWEGDGGWEVQGDDSEWGSDAPARGAQASDSDDEADAINLAGEHESLSDFLHRQALSLRLGEVDRAALRFLIENLNDDGYLEDSLVDLAEGLAGSSAHFEQLEELVHHFTVALRLLQTLEPVGVGARNLSECMRLQLQHLQARGEGEPNVLELALRMCEQPLDLLARRDTRRLAQACSVPESHIRPALALITRLEPKPGRRFVEVERHIIVPDVIVHRINRRTADGTPQFHVQLNPDVMPRLRVHDVYAGALRSHRGTEGHAALQQRLQEARWFIKNVQQRFDTILRVSRAIVERQKNFFVHGELAMRPLVLRDIADELGLHESTISRVTTAKYMSTPHGTYELKYFFGSGLGTETGGNASSTAVRALIKQFVAAESSKKPLSDNQIAEMLKEQGIECARRTVAKYREALKIPPANLRKALA